MFGSLFTEKGKAASKQLIALRRLFIDQRTIQPRTKPKNLAKKQKKQYNLISTYGRNTNKER